MRRRYLLLIPVITLLFLAAGYIATRPDSKVDAATLAWGSTGQEVKDVQYRLRQWGYYNGPIDGIYGAETYRAVILFQQRNGLTPDGVVGNATKIKLGLPTTGGGAAAQPRTDYTPSQGVARDDDVYLLARVIHAEAGAEPYEGKVAVGAVILNRVKHPSFPNTLAGVIYQPLAFESVSNGIINRPPSAESIRAARDAINGWDPTYGATFFWNPYKKVSQWIWSRPIVRQIGQHVFAK